MRDARLLNATAAKATASFPFGRVIPTIYTDTLMYQLHSQPLARRSSGGLG